MILTLMIKRAKRLELIIFLYNQFEDTFGSNMLLILKNMDFGDVALTKVNHIYTIKGMIA
jgi:hypothetical protein